MTDSFVDYYELLELSPRANMETIERVFRFFATKWHPDVGGDKNRFATLLQAFETLRDPSSRAGYDALYFRRQEQADNLIQAAGKAGHDAVDRHKLLCLYYAKRRQNGKQPSLGITTVERMMGCPAETLDFHLWYFKEKGWIQREASGGFSITADGVDRIESTEVAKANHKLITSQRASGTEKLSA